MSRGLHVDVVVFAVVMWLTVWRKIGLVPEVGVGTLKRCFG